MRISDWSSDVCSSDLSQDQDDHRLGAARRQPQGDVRPRPQLPARAVQTLKPSPCTGRKWEVVYSRPPSAVFWKKQRTMATSSECPIPFPLRRGAARTPEEGRVGNGGVRKRNHRWSPYH